MEDDQIRLCGTFCMRSTATSMIAVMACDESETLCDLIVPGISYATSYSAALLDTQTW